MWNANGERNLTTSIKISKKKYETGMAKIVHATPMQASFCNVGPLVFSLLL